MPAVKQFMNPETIKPKQIPVAALLGGPAELISLTGDVGLDNDIVEKNLHRPQLALTGFTELFTYKRVQIFGNTEMYYLQSLSEGAMLNAMEYVFQFNVPCIILTNNHTVSDIIIQRAKKRQIPILQTKQPTVEAYSKVSGFLSDHFAEQMTVHGSFVDIYGCGVLFVGKSGIGKSEICLDLVERGHRLVADDIVVLTQKSENIIMGTGTETVGHFMEIRGLGIIDVRRMFGLKAIRFQKRLEIIVELETWNNDTEYTRTGLDNEPIKVLDANIFHVKLPILPGKNITVISEVIALNYLLNTYGYNAAEAFQEQLSKAIKKKSEGKNILNDVRMVNYFLDDE